MFRDESTKLLPPFGSAQVALCRVMNMVRQLTMEKSRMEMATQSVAGERKRAFHGLNTRKIIEREKVIHSGLDGWIRDPDAESFPPWSRKEYYLLRKGAEQELEVLRKR